MFSCPNKIGTETIIPINAAEYLQRQRIERSVSVWLTMSLNKVTGKKLHSMYPVKGLSISLYPSILMH